MFRNAAVKGREKLDNIEMDLGEKKSSGLCGIPAGPQTALLLLSPGQELLTLPKVSRQAQTGGTARSLVQAQSAVPASPSKASFSSSLRWVKPLLLNGQIQA